jgi:hypothetical protein
VTTQGPEDDDAADRLVGLLHNELRTSRSKALAGGKEAEEVTGDITERVQRIRELNAAGWPNKQDADSEQ